jgi:hypothetical protein
MAKPLSREKEAKKAKCEHLATLNQETYQGEFRSGLDQLIGSVNEQELGENIGRRLQINRLRALRFRGVLVLVILLLAAPLLINTENFNNWPSHKILLKGGIEIFGWLNVLAMVFGWLNALAMMILGAVGGFLSGLLQARSTRITLPEYLESMLRLQLRPLVGALVALILYIVLSWQVLPGIKIENTGSYFLIAFLAGFSERYFLRLLRTEASDEEIKEGGGEN